MPCPPTVLVVDDHASTLSLYGFVLEMMGCGVMTSASGPEALRLACERPPNVVVTDFAMPGMDGIQLCEALKAHPATQHVPVLMVSGQIHANVAELALAAGCTEVLSKPCLPEDLFAAVERAWERAQSACGETRAIGDMARAGTSEATTLRSESQQTGEKRRDSETRQG